MRVGDVGGEGEDVRGVEVGEGAAGEALGTVVEGYDGGPGLEEVRQEMEVL